MAAQVLQVVIVQLQVKLAHNPISLAVIKLFTVTAESKDIRQIVARRAMAETIPVTEEDQAAEEAGINKIMDVLVAVALEDILVLVAKVIAIHHIVAEILDPVLVAAVAVAAVQHLPLALAEVEGVLVYMDKDPAVLVEPVIGMVRPPQPQEALVEVVGVVVVVGSRAILAYLAMVMAVHTVAVVLEQTMEHLLAPAALVVFESCGDQHVRSRLMRLNKDIIK
jgi:hypothetical protein